MQETLLNGMFSGEDTGGPSHECCELSLFSTPTMTSVEERELWPLTDDTNADSSSLDELVNSSSFQSLGNSNINLDLTI